MVRSFPYVDRSRVRYCDVHRWSIVVAEWHDFRREGAEVDPSSAAVHTYGEQRRFEIGVPQQESVPLGAQRLSRP
jgi:hypothetical protein